MSLPLLVRVVRLTGADDLPLPEYQTAGSAGMDLHAAVNDIVIVKCGGRAAIPTGIAIALPPDFEAQVRGRSGLARKFGVSMANGVGTIDSDYRGEIQVLLINHGTESFQIRRGDRIAQLVIAPVQRVVWSEVEALDETKRGDGGFGHTGSTHPA